MLFRRRQQNNQPEQDEKQRMQTVKKDVLIKGGVVVITVIVTVVLVFAMTAAWFTNVASTNNLNFQVESWGFEGDVEVNQDIIKAAPGSSGFLTMKITSSGEKDSKLSVGISKEFMRSDQLRQRVFFYADTTSTINGELVDKVYLTNNNAYPYYLPAHNQLILSEQVFTDVRLKWEWVYDVVGYYFRGTPNGSAFEVAEYLRPAEYNFDDATFDSDGRLIKVDPTTDLVDYLADLTSRDGYAGAFTAGMEDGKKVLMKDGQKVTTTLDCYPIDPENNIWLYLCSQREIQNNTVWDTQYGMAGLEVQQLFQVRMTVIGQQSDPLTVQVADPAALKNALLAGGNETIALQQDMVLTEAVKLPDGTQAVLDLNGHTLSCTQTIPFTVQEDAKLTVRNGTISGDSATTTAIYSMGGQITLSKVNIENVKTAISVEDCKTADPNGANSFVRILNCDISTQNVAIKLWGDGNASAENTVLVVQNSQIRSNYMGISGNGTISNPGRFGTEIQILDSEIYGLYAGVYHPQMQSTMTITRSDISGITGIAVKGGYVNVIDSAVRGLGTDNEVVAPTENKLSGSGFIDTGDGIYVESSYDYPIRVSVSGNCEISHTAQNSQAVRVFPESSMVQINLTGGSYSTDVSAYLKPSYVCTLVEEKFIVAPQQ